MKWFMGLTFWKKILTIWLGLSLLISIFSILRMPDETGQISKDDILKNKSEAIADSLEKEKDKPLYAYIHAKNLVKENLKDPDSFKELSNIHHRIKKTKDGAEIEVVIEYTATNSFGGRVRGTNIFLYNNDLRLLKVREL